MRTTTDRAPHRVLALAATCLVVAALLAGCDAAGASPSASPALSAEAQALEMLAHGTRSERADAADKLAELGARDAVPALVAALADEAWIVRWRSAVALGVLHDASAVEPLLALAAAEPGPPSVSDSDLDEAKGAYLAAITALGALGDARAAPRLVALAVGDETGEAGTRATTAVQAIGAPAIPAVSDAITTSTGDAATVAVGLLATLGPEALDPLAALLGDSRPAVRSAAAQELAVFGRDAVAPLVRALGATDRALRAEAARSLGKIGDTAATAGLVRLLSDTETVSAATWALAKIHADDATPLVRYLNAKTTVGVYRALIRIGQDDTVAALVKALKSFGTKTMAEAYLNCGNPTLENAAKTWATAHGYTVVTKPGTGEETWGGS